MSRAALDGRDERPGRAAEPDLASLADRSFSPGLDAASLLALRCLRAASLGLLSWGAAVAVAVAGSDGDVSRRLSSPGAIVDSLASPFAVLALGVILRVALTPCAFALALAFVVLRGHLVPRSRRPGPWARATDTVRVASAYQSLRWTSAAKDRAVADLGRTGTTLRRTERVLHVLTAVGCAAFVVVAVSAPAGAAAAEQDRSSLAAERLLAERYAPVVRLVDQETDCGPGEPYHPSDVRPLMGNDSVALRGPWTSRDLIEVAPRAEDLAAGLDGYALDFPGNPLKPGCRYEQWADRTFRGSPITVYAHVATETPAYPGRLALQYWFYYPFNDFNNKHESDWERVQLEFDAPDAASALDTEPTRAVYSQHEGAERAAWDDDKLIRVDDTHAVVYVAAGSHASHFQPGLYLLRSRTQGFGCDTALEPTTAHDPVVETIPSSRRLALRAFPWIGYEGAWGERQSVSFYDGATGPNAHDQWRKPFTWSATSTDRSYPVPGGAVYGVKTTDFFCDLVGEASVTTLRLTADPLPTLAVLAALLAGIVWLVRRTAWGDSAPLPVTRRRTFGQTVSDSWAVYRSHLGLFLGIGGLVAAASLPVSLLGQLLADPPGSVGGPRPGGVAVAVQLLGVVVLGAMVLLSQAATAAALRELDAGRDVGPGRAYRLALARAGPLLLTTLLWLVVVAVLLATLWLAVLALVAALLLSLFVPVVQLEARSGPSALLRSVRLVRGQWVKVALLMVFGAALTSFVGGLVGTVVLLLAQAPFVVVNVLPGVVSALLTPFVSLLFVYAFFHGVAAQGESPASSDRARADVETP